MIRVFKSKNTKICTVSVCICICISYAYSMHTGMYVDTGTVCGEGHCKPGKVTPNHLTEIHLKDQQEH